MSRVITNLAELPQDLCGGGVAVGNFDGVHCGHAELIGQLLAESQQVGGPSLVLTFDPPPIALLRPETPPPPPLSTIVRRAELLENLGVDGVIAYPTDFELLSLSASAFFQEILVDKLQAKAIVEGPNFRFGKGRAGDTQMLRQLCDSAGIRLKIVDAKVAQDTMISSTRIRNCISLGEIEEANEMLTEPYQLHGRVVAGAKRGRQLGFPTANLTGIETLLPAHGVYAAAWLTPAGAKAAAVNIGPNPTFEEAAAKVEVHIIDYAGAELYGQDMRIALLQRIRGVRKFDSIDDLRQQVSRDVQRCREAGRVLIPLPANSNRPDT